jgi:hypothetical protein
MSSTTLIGSLKFDFIFDNDCKVVVGVGKAIDDYVPVSKISTTVLPFYRHRFLQSFSFDVSYRFYLRYLPKKKKEMKVRQQATKKKHTHTQ